MVTIKVKGNFKNTESFFKRARDQRKNMQILDRYAKQGVDTLSSATPIDTGKTSASWAYAITADDGYYRIDWFNTNVNNGVNIAILLQYGHATGTGGFVQGRDFVNPSIQPVFEQMANEIWEELTK